MVFKLAWISAAVGLEPFCAPVPTPFTAAVTTGPNVNATLAVVAVAFCEIVMVGSAGAAGVLICKTVVPAGMPAPATGMPTVRPEMLMFVMVLLLIVVLPVRATVNEFGKASVGTSRPANLLMNVIVNGPPELPDTCT